MSLLTNAQAYNFQELSIQQGLPQSQAYALVFDSAQHAWIGTQGGGLCKYDGFDFTYFTKKDSLISNRIFCLKIINNEIWVGQKGGVSVFYQNGHFKTNFRLPSTTIIVNDIETINGELFLATDFGPYYIKDKIFVPYEANVTLKGKNTFSFFQTKKETWLCTEQGLLSFDKPLSKINKSRGLRVDQVQCAVEYGDYWVIGTYGGGIEIYSQVEGVLKSNPFASLKSEIILSLFVSKNGELWIGTLNSGVYVYSRSDGVLKNYQSHNGLSNNHVRTIVTDLWDNVWIGTSGGGISIFQNSPFIKYNTSSGLNGNYIYSVINSRKNEIWAGTEGGGIVRINDTSAIVFDEEYGFYSEKVKAIYEDYNGNIWLGTEGRGLGIYSPYDAKDTIYTFHISDGMTSEWIRCFAQLDKKSPIYIGTGGGGVMQVNRSWEFPLRINFRKAKLNNGEYPERIGSLDYIGRQLWYTTAEGEYGFSVENELKYSNEIAVSFRNCVGYKNKRWLGTSDNGILKLVVNKDSVLTEEWIGLEEGLSSNNIYQLKLRGNELWVGTERGLDQLVLDSLGNIKSIEHFGYEEGFEGLETNINATDLDEQGNIWFGSVDGLYLYQGGEVNYNQRRPPVLRITDFSIFYEPIVKTEYSDYYKDGQIVKDLMLPYDMNHIGFSFKAIHYTYGKNIQYTWKLSGADPDWTPPSKITTATYSNLQPGSYVFQVKASINDNWDVDPVKIAFRIDQPYYEKFWFKAGYYLLIFIVLTIIVLLVIVRLRRKNKTITEKLEMEKNLIELEQKALRLQMNPHFIFNVLTSIHNLIILNDSDKARYALSKFSKLMRMVLENSREKFISVDEEIETLENYVQLEKLTANLAIELEVIVDENVDPAEAILPPLMIQPFVENAIIHGLKELDYPGKIKVGFKLLNDHLLECFIEDNGRGRKKAAQINAQKDNYHKSTALQVTQERLANLNKTAEFIPFEIIDLTDQNNNPSGTKVVMRILI